jgi:hypothetical protein
MAGTRPQWKTLIVLLAVVACDYGQVTLVAPAPRVGPVTLLVQADSEDAAPARELGWSSGIPDAVVTLTAQDSAIAPQMGRTDAGGRVSFPQVVAGGYVVEVHRWLSVAELGQLAAREDVIGFAAVRGVSHDGSAGTHAVRAPASRQRSLVISEWSFNYPTFGDYPFTGFLELYNNGDTTVYLDGMIVGETLPLSYDFPKFPCAAYETLTNDPDALWARRLDRFPGQGRDYPLGPDATTVIATDAIDHRSFVSGALDLRDANFDFAGPADVHNPTVPDMIDVGLSPMVLGHGTFYNVLTSVVFVALPLNVTALPRQRVPVDGSEWAAVPRAAVLDVVALRSPFEAGYPRCPTVIHRNFDRLPADLIGLGDQDFAFSANRKVAVTRTGGRKILQHTRTARADFYRGPRTPHIIP